MKIALPSAILALSAVFSMERFVGAQTNSAQLTLVRLHDEAVVTLPTVLEGQVATPEGWPAEGAVVMSSAGGRAVTGADGSFWLEVELPLDASSVQVSAVQRIGTLNAASNAQVTVEHPGGVNPVGVLTLAQGGICQPAWLPTFGGHPGLDREVHALAVSDDGSGDGPALYVGGLFTSAGGVTANHIAKWNGASWSPLGDGTDGWVHVLTVFDDGRGGGPALYAGGNFTTAGGEAANRIAKWNGTSWSPLGVGMDYSVLALAVFDDGGGGGPALYAAGQFTTAGGVAANRIAKWNGTSWSALGGGMNGSIRALTVFDDGSGGPALYAGGGFTTASGVRVNNIAKWNGTSWSALGSGIDFAGVSALTVFDDGSGAGPALLAGGFFRAAGGVAASNIAKWNGTSWSPLGSGLNSHVLALTIFEDGSGPALYAGGYFTSTGDMGVNSIARWNGTSWSPLAGGMSPEDSEFGFAMTVFDDGRGGPALYAGGFFRAAGNVAADHIAKWNGTSWSALGNEMNRLNGAVFALTVFNNGSRGEQALYAGGDFTFAGGVATKRVAKWNGTSWSPLGQGMDDQVRALTVFNDGRGGGPELHAGGYFRTADGLRVNGIAKWNGRSWSPLGSGFPYGSSSVLAAFDDGSGPALYAGGYLSTSDDAAANHIAKWDGTSWSPVGTGTDGFVSALAVFDDGSGPALYVGGSFRRAGAAAANSIAKWNGSVWTPLGSGMNGSVTQLTVFNDGSGGRLYASGNFTTADGAAANRIAKWNGTGWSAVGTGMNDFVAGLTVFDDGSGAGSALYAGGRFTTAGGVAANHVAKWNGRNWSPLGAGMSELFRSVGPLTGFYDPSGNMPALYAGGNFLSAVDSGDSYLARWQSCFDRVAPELSCPTSVVVSDLGSPGETVTFSVTATDDQDPSPSVVCVPPSGSTFPPGTTLVTCKAMDAARNQSNCAFPVTVQRAKGVR